MMHNIDYKINKYKYKSNNSNNPVYKNKLLHYINLKQKNMIGGDNNNNFKIFISKNKSKTTIKCYEQQYDENIKKIIDAYPNFNIILEQYDRCNYNNKNVRIVEQFDDTVNNMLLKTLPKIVLESMELSENERTLFLAYFTELRPRYSFYPSENILPYSSNTITKIVEYLYTHRNEIDIVQKQEDALKQKTMEKKGFAKEITFLPAGTTVQILSGGSKSNKIKNTYKNMKLEPMYYTNYKYTIEELDNIKKNIKKNKIDYNKYMSFIKEYKKMFFYVLENVKKQIIWIDMLLLRIGFKYGYKNNDQQKTFYSYGVMYSDSPFEHLGILWNNKIGNKYFFIYLLDIYNIIPISTKKIKKKIKKIISTYNNILSSNNTYPEMLIITEGALLKNYNCNKNFLDLPSDGLCKLFSKKIKLKVPNNFIKNFTKLEEIHLDIDPQIKIKFDFSNSNINNLEIHKKHKNDNNKEIFYTDEKNKNIIIVESNKGLHKWKIFNNDKETKDNSNTFIYKDKIIKKEYMIHDNGGRPFKVIANNKEIRVFTYDENEYNYKDECKEYIYNIELLHFTNFIGYWSGYDLSKCKADGNSILIKETKTSYVSIGMYINRFETTEEIYDYISPIGNSDVPYPVAYSENYVYFMLDSVFVDKKYLSTQATVKNAELIYSEFYGHLFPENQHMMKNNMFINDTILIDRKY